MAALKTEAKYLANAVFRHAMQKTWLWLVRTTTNQDVLHFLRGPSPSLLLMLLGKGTVQCAKSVKIFIRSRDQTRNIYLFHLSIIHCVVDGIIWKIRMLLIFFLLRIINTVCPIDIQPTWYLWLESIFLCPDSDPMTYGTWQVTYLNSYWRILTLKMIF